MTHGKALSAVKFEKRTGAGRKEGNGIDFPPTAGAAPAIKIREGIRIRCVRGFGDPPCAPAARGERH